MGVRGNACETDETSQTCAELHQQRETGGGRSSSNTGRRCNFGICACIWRTRLSTGGGTAARTRGASAATPSARPEPSRSARPEKQLSSQLWFAGGKPSGAGRLFSHELHRFWRSEGSEEAES
ncbi:unnamed protein product [Pleuronectes platessa]|uniref:Uncharacterized protein n=1 Tax=Pleuronectes platessa TaxID=8262 RepID=A0A9N7YE31_PLEPL|nr:unnamed protein product [Pleuronectes platessa]